MVQNIFMEHDLNISYFWHIIKMIILTHTMHYWLSLQIYPCLCLSLFIYEAMQINKHNHKCACHESGSHSLKLHITHGLHFPSCTALTHSRPPLHQSHSCHHSLINSDCLTTPAPHSLTHIKAAHKHSPSAKSCFPRLHF